MIEFQTFDQTAFRVARFAELYHWLVWPWDTMALLERRGGRGCCSQGLVLQPNGAAHTPPPVVHRTQPGVHCRETVLSFRHELLYRTSHPLVDTIYTKSPFLSLSRLPIRAGSNNRKSFKGTLKFCCCKISKKNKKKKQKDPSPELNNRGRRRKKCDEWGNNARRG